MAKKSKDAVQRPKYNVAADVLAFAFTRFKEGQLESCLELCSVAMESDGIEQLVESLNAINAESDVGIEVDAENSPDGTRPDGSPHDQLSDGDDSTTSGDCRPDGSDDPALSENKVNNDASQGGGVKTINKVHSSSAERRLQKAIGKIAQEWKVEADDDDCDDDDDDDLSGVDFDDDDGDDDGDDDDGSAGEKVEGNMLHRLRTARDRRTAAHDRECQALARKISLSGTTESRRIAREMAGTKTPKSARK